MKTIRIYLAAIAVVSLIAGYALRPEKAVDERSTLKELGGEAVFSEKSGTPPHYKADSDVVAYNSYDVTPHIRGYAGPIKVLVVLGRDGRIRGIKIIEHRETKNYVHYMELPQYLGRFIGKSVFDRFEIDMDLDGISRATVSVEALARTVRDSSRIVAANVYGIAVKTDVSDKASGAKWLLYALLFLLALAGYFITRKSKKYLRIRDACMIAGLVVIGLYLSSPFSILHVFNLMMLRPSSSVLWYVIIGSALLSVIIAGRFYCGWLCPFGALSELIGRLPVRKWAVPVEMDDRWRKAKYIILMIAAAVVFFSRRSDYGNFETYVTLFSYHGNVLTWALVVVALAVGLRIERFWCRYLCPVAALTGALSKKVKGYVSGSDCPMGNKPDPLISECIRCNRCYQPSKQSDMM